MTKGPWQMSLALLLAISAAAAARVPAPCSPEDAKARGEFQAKVAESRPGDPLYLPHLHPRALKDVLEDFAHHHSEVWSDVPFSKMPFEEQRLFSLLESGKANVKLEKVDDWTPLRCEGRQRTFFNVLRIFDGTTEITRVALDDWGFVAYLEHKPTDPDLAAKFPKPFPDPEEAQGVLARVLSERIEHSRLISTDGTVRCTALIPCVAFDIGSEALVSLMEGKEPKRVVRLLLDGPQFSRAMMFATTLGERTPIAKFMEEGKEVVWVGRHAVLGEGIYPEK